MRPGRKRTPASPLLSGTQRTTQASRSPRCWGAPERRRRRGGTDAHFALFETLERAEELIRQSKDVRGRAELLRLRGAICRKSLRRPDEALRHLEEALKLDEALADKEGKAETLLYTGLCHDSMGQYRQALKAYEKALSLYVSLGDKVGEASCIQNQGIVFFRMRQLEQALKKYEQALRLSEEIGYNLGIATALRDMAAHSSSCGRHAEALQTYKMSLAVQRVIRLDVRVLNSLINIVTIGVFGLDALFTCFVLLRFGLSHLRSAGRWARTYIDIRVGRKRGRRLMGMYPQMMRLIHHEAHPRGGGGEPTAESSVKAQRGGEPGER